MANVNAPFGLRPYRYRSGAPYNGAANLYRIPSTDANNYFIGDPVLPAGTSDANGIPDVTICTAGASNYVLGPIVSIAPGGEPVVAVTRDLPIYRQASTATYVLVADDPWLIFAIQETANMGTTAPMNNANLSAGSGGSTNTGLSSWQLNSTGFGTGNTLQMRVLRLLHEADNVVGTNARWLAQINLHSLTNLTGV